MVIIHQTVLQLPLAQTYVAKCMYKQCNLASAYLQDLISTLTGVFAYYTCRYARECFICNYMHLATCI